MECDIHFYVERRDGGQWVSCDTWKKEEGDEIGVVPYENLFYRKRNYSLFAILADVRNGRGFAGIKTGEGFNPIAAPRGVPVDCCQEYRALQESYGEDGHSHSFFTVAELMAFDWTQTTTLCGIVDGKNFEDFMRWRKARQEPPNEYYGDRFCPSVRAVGNEEMAAAVKSVTDRKIYGAEFLPALQEATLGMHTRVEWAPSYSRCCRDFLSDTLPRLWRLGKPEEVRIVFFFYN